MSQVSEWLMQIGQEKATYRALRIFHGSRSSPNLKRTVRSFQPLKPVLSTELREFGRYLHKLGSIVRGAIFTGGEAVCLHTSCEKILSTAILILL